MKRAVILVLMLTASLLVPHPATAAAKELVSSAPSVDFGQVPVYWTTTTESITVTNAGAEPVTITDVRLAGPDIVDTFHLSGDCVGTLAPAGSCTINAYFQPQVAGTATAQVEIASDAATSPTIGLTGTATAQQTAIEPQRLSFPGQELNTSSAARQITFTNAGVVPLTVNVAVDGPDAALFSSTDNCSAGVLSTMSSCVLNVTFTPTTSGIKTAQVTVTTSDSAFATMTVPLSGQAGIPVASLSANTIAFGDQRLGTDTVRELKVTNTGTFPLTLADISVSGAGFTATNTCSGPIAIDGFCTVSVTFSPNSLGSSTGSLSVDGQVVPLSGAGTRPELTVDSAVAFGGQEVTSTGERTLQLRNTGSMPLTISGIGVSGAEQFSVSAGCVVIPADESCPVSLRFTPTSLATFTASLTVRSDGGTRSVALSGTGTRAEVALSTDRLDFGTWPVGTESTAAAITVSNPGTATLRVTGTSLSGTGAPRFSVGTGCSLVTAGGQCQINVRFRPTDRGVREATLSVETNRGTLPVALRGDSAGAIVVTQQPTRPLKLAKKLTRTPTQLLRVPVRTNADQIAGISITPQRRVYVRSDQKWVYVNVVGKRAARITVHLSAPAVPGYSAYSYKKVYKVKRAR